MMKNLLQKLSLVFILIFSVSKINAQTPTNNVQTVQPKIMVIPYVSEGEDLRYILESDVDKRIALTKIKEVFDSRGFTTVDFVAKLKSEINFIANLFLFHEVSFSFCLSITVFI